MDPLSLTANLIAVINAASAVCKNLQKISRLRNAPEELFQFHNEISDVQVVLVLVREASAAGLGGEDPGAMQVLGALVGHATAALHEFDDIVQNKIGVRVNKATVTVSNFSWRAWLRNASRLRKLSTDLRAIRLEINSTLTMITACEIPRTRIRLAEVALQSSNAANIMERFEESTTKQVEAISASVSTLQSFIVAMQTALPDPASSVRIQTSLFSKGVCSQTCLCRCHKFVTHAFPEWLETVVGRVLVGYSGIPYRPSCNERGCQPDASCLLTVSYYFPKWFLGRRMLSLRHRWSPTQGHAMTIRTPRVLSSSMEQVFMVVQTGNIPALSMLFTQGLASPFDVEPVGFASLLGIAVSQYDAQTCAFLFNQCADPNIEDYRGVSATDMVCNMIWTQSHNPKVKAIKDVFEKHTDLDEKIGDRGFTMLHRIILNLSPINLRNQLQTSTIELDLPCSMGRTPLQWAVLQPDTRAMETLIEFGANFHMQDVGGKTALHTIVRFGTARAVEIFVTAMVSRFKKAHLEGQTATRDGKILVPDYIENVKFCLEQLTMYGHTALGLCTFEADRSEVIKILLEAGADIDANSSADCWPIGHAIVENRHANTRLLLERGAQLDWVTTDMQGILHTVAQYGDIESIHVIAGADRLRGLDIEHKDSSGHTPLETFDMVRPQCTLEDEATFSECREAFLVLLTRARDDTGNESPMEKIIVEESEYLKVPEEGEEVDEFHDAEEDL